MQPVGCTYGYCCTHRQPPDGPGGRHPVALLRPDHPPADQERRTAGRPARRPRDRAADLERRARVVADSGPSVVPQSRGAGMTARASGVSRKQLDLIRKTLKANPGCSIRMTRANGETNVQLVRGTDRASKRARLKA